MDLTEERWAVIAPLLVEKSRLKCGNVDGRVDPAWRHGRFEAASSES